MTKIDIFRFLDEASAREPFIMDVLGEILSAQNRSLPEGSTPLATPEHLKKTPAVKIPFNQSREKTIDYLLDLLATRFREHVRVITSFDFRVDEESKRLAINETREYTVAMGPKDLEHIAAQRLERSRESLQDLLKKFRFFNLSKLIRSARNKDEMLRIIGRDEGKTFFIFKNFSMDKNKVEVQEDYCFHAVNYGAVRDSINIARLNEIIAAYNEPVMRRLKNFGILTPAVSDYRDHKLDYVFNILLNDIPTVLSERDRIDTKNAFSLRAGVIKSEEMLDPVQTIGKDIARHVNECVLCPSGDLTGVIPELTDDVLRQWMTPENLRAYRIVSHVGDGGVIHFIDGARLVAHFEDLVNRSIANPEKLDSMQHAEKTKILNSLDILCRVSRGILSSTERRRELQYTDEDAAKLKGLAEAFDAWQKQKQEKEKRQHEAQRVPAAGARPTSKSFIGAILDFFRSLFGGKESPVPRAREISTVAERPVAPHIKPYIRRTAESQAPLIPLSDMIELIPENDETVSQLIEEIREKNVRIVVPVYGARDVLYPKRSQKLLIPDIEYLLVPVDAARSPETVIAFTQSVEGTKVKDEVISTRAIIAIEKYLLKHYRQRRSQLIRREM
ncbi:MAG: hypothetical protein EPN93_14640 [Spirochaetes bacterium]|nr:MAG: hypothetical protein EPN93_14640 [Spirochaetota bacterium]